MRLQSPSFSSRLAIRLVFAGVSAAFLAGCAESDRLSSDPLSNPFATARAPQPAPNAGYAQADPVAPVQSRPLAAPVQSRPLGPVASYAIPARPSPHLAAAPAPTSPDMTASVKRGGPLGWSAEGGMPVIVTNGETADIIAKRYGVPPDALLRTNGIGSASQVRPGTRLVIPVYNASLAASSGARVAAAAPAEPKAHVAAATHAGHEQMRFVKGAQPVAVAAAKTHKAQPVVAEAKTHKAAPAAVAAAETKPKHVAAATPAKTVVAAAPAMKIAKADAPAAGKKVAVDPTPTASLPPQTSVAPPTAAEAPKVAAATEAAGPEFRWPARGRIIQGFKSGGNDGINIAVPEGTQVKAAENGVVAYAGSELKGYGNLVLIRHPNGFVSAYANNGDIEVKRGDTVKRGQTIAKSGQSGNVASPQLHFELRKGSTPVDPTQYLAGL